MAKTFAKAVPERKFMKMGFYGRTGSGKTLTALLVAEGLVQRDGGRIAFVDTEHGTAFYDKTIAERRVHPAAFDFDRIVTRSLFETLEAIESMDPKEHSVLVIDSITHLWDAAKASYNGKLTSKGGIPVQAWGQIKKPYKRIMSLFLDGQFHAIICGREGVEMEDDDDGNAVVVGKKMKAEGETQFEPHMLVQMKPHREEDGTHIISAFVEKDRSGILTGKIIDWPTYATFEPVIEVLSGSGATSKLGTPEENAERDASAREVRDEQDKNERAELFNTIKTAITRADSIDALKAAWILTSGKKGKLGEDYFTQLETAKEARKSDLMAKVA
jgi:thymidine kinase